MAYKGKMMPKVTCPCCGSTGWIVWFEPDSMTIERRDPCSHCEGTGEVDAEEEEQED